MVEDFDNFLSTNIKRSKRSVIRELLKLISNPELISFAGGLPSPDAFPIEEIKQICNEIIPIYGKTMMQYGPTEGDPELRSELLKRAKQQGMNVTEKNLLITTASQQGLDLVSKTFIDIDDSVIVGMPTYLGGLSAFRNYGADIHGIKLDKGGLKADDLEKKIIELKNKGKKIKFVYVVPDFQNPSGITMTEKRRLQIIELAKKYNLFILEDSPYRELRYIGEHVPTLYSLDNSGQVILLGTFSKTFIPGFRIGWVFGNEKVIDKITVAKQGTDLCTPPFNQKIAAEFLKKGLLDKQIKKVKKLYKNKMEIMLSALKKYMPKEATWTEVEGGLFLLLIAPEHVDFDANFNKAVEKNVAYVIGNAFTHNNSMKNTMRLNFSFASLEQIEEGIKRLGDMVKSLL